MKKKIVFALGLLVLSAFCASAAGLDPKIEGIIAKIRDNQDKVRDFSANITTMMKTSAQGGKSIEQKGSIMIKGNDMSRIEMKSPVPQLTITNKDKLAVVNPATGQKFVQDLKKLRKESGKQELGQNPLDQTKILDYFTLSVEEKGLFQKSYVITGIPKTKNQMMGKIKFYVDKGRSVPTKIEIFNPEGKLVSSTNIEYANIAGINVISKNSSWIETPQGKMEVTMSFNDIKVNKGIPDKEFEIK